MGLSAREIHKKVSSRHFLALLQKSNEPKQMWSCDSSSVTKELCLSFLFKVYLPSVQPVLMDTRIEDQNTKGFLLWLSNFSQCLFMLANSQDSRVTIFYKNTDKTGKRNVPLRMFRYSYSLLFLGGLRRRGSFTDWSRCQSQPYSAASRIKHPTPR